MSLRLKPIFPILFTLAITACGPTEKDGSNDPQDNNEPTQDTLVWDETNFDESVWAE